MTGLHGTDDDDDDAMMATTVQNMTYEVLMILMISRSLLRYSIGAAQTTPPIFTGT